MWIKLLHCKVELISKLINYSMLRYPTTIKVMNIQNWEMWTHMKTNIYGKIEPNLEHEVHMLADLTWNDPLTWSYIIHRVHYLIRHVSFRPFLPRLLSTATIPSGFKRSAMKSSIKIDRGFSWDPGWLQYIFPVAKSKTSIEPSLTMGTNFCRSG